MVGEGGEGGVEGTWIDCNCDDDDDDDDDDAGDDDNIDDSADGGDDDADDDDADARLRCARPWGPCRAPASLRLFLRTCPRLPRRQIVVLMMMLLMVMVMILMMSTMRMVLIACLLYTSPSPRDRSLS
eukprot:9493573-Pyramimonas_sp.AAC.1